MKNLFRNACMQSMLANTSRTARSIWTANYIQKPGAGKIQTVTLIPGYGIGPEITSTFFFVAIILFNTTLKR